MPLPLGHSAIGLTISSLSDKSNSTFTKIQHALFVTLLANLPDIDVVIGLLFQSNGNAYHRGPTHSLVFALLAGYIASKSHRLWSKLPALEFSSCFFIVVSHTIADMLLTNGAVSLLWPLQVNWSIGYSSWMDVINSVVFDAIQDIGIVLVCIGILFIRYAGMDILRLGYQKIKN